MNVTPPVDFTRCVSFEKNLEYFVVLLYAVPSLVIYLLVIIVLFRRLKAPFYRIFALGGLLVSPFECNPAQLVPGRALPGINPTRRPGKDPAPYKI